MRQPLLTLALCSACLGWASAAPAQDAEGPWFREVARERGLPAELFSSRNLFCDLDGDTWPDVVLNWERVFRNVPDPQGGRRFEEQPGGLGLRGEGPRPSVVCFGDLDHDGDRDAVVLWNDDPTDPKQTQRKPRARIYWQVAPFRFEAAKEPLPLPPEAVIAAGLFDREGDGWLDLVTGASYKARGGPYEAYPVHLLAGGPRGSFRDATAAAGLSLVPEAGRLDSRRPTFGVSFADLNGDGNAEILLCAYGRQRNLLYLGQGDGTFREVGLATGFAGDADTSGAYSAEIKEFFRRRYGQPRADEKPFRSNGNSFDAPCADVDNDGDLDCFLGEITHAWAGPSSDRSALLMNEGPPLRFRRDDQVGKRNHQTPRWNQGDLHVGWLDADNDGWLDLLLASGEYPDDQRLRLFRQHPPGTFVEVTQLAGLDWDMCTGLSLADYDKDGDVDVLVGKSNMRLPKERRQGRVLRPALFENVVGSKRAWLSVRLVGAGPQAGGAARDALGARVTLWTAKQRLTREVVGSKGHAGHNDALEAHFGLGSAERVERLEVRWPSRRRTRSVLRDVRPNQALVIRQGE